MRTVKHYTRLKGSASAFEQVLMWFTCTIKFEKHCLRYPLLWPCPSPPSKILQSQGKCAHSEHALLLEYCPGFCIAKFPSQKSWVNSGLKKSEVNSTSGNWQYHRFNEIHSFGVQALTEVAFPTKHLLNAGCRAQFLQLSTQNLGPHSKNSYLLRARSKGLIFSKHSSNFDAGFWWVTLVGIFLQKEGGLTVPMWPSSVYIPGHACQLAGNSQVAWNSWNPLHSI